MPINVEQALGEELPSQTHSWDEDRVMLYHLSIGAGDPATDPDELEYAYESHLKVLPSFASIPTFSTMMGLTQVGGLDVNPLMILHGEQDIELERPLPTRATVTTHGIISDIYDKGTGALVITEVTTRDDRGDPLFVTRASLFVRGEGGFGGDSGPPASYEPPDREPDHRVESRTLPQQALLYRLNGDKNPLHADPAVAAVAGFDRPILHGLATYGIVCKAVVGVALSGDVARVARYQARFAGVVFPGETIVTSVWQDGERLLVHAVTKERGEPVVTNAALTVR